MEYRQLERLCGMEHGTTRRKRKHYQQLPVSASWRLDLFHNCKQQRSKCFDFDQSGFTCECCHELGLFIRSHVTTDGFDKLVGLYAVWNFGCYVIPEHKWVRAGRTYVGQP